MKCHAGNIYHSGWLALSFPICCRISVWKYNRWNTCIGLYIQPCPCLVDDICHLLLTVTSSVKREILFPIVSVITFTALNNNYTGIGQCAFKISWHVYYVPSISTLLVSILFNFQWRHIIGNFNLGLSQLDPHLIQPSTQTGKFFSDTSNLGSIFQHSKQL